MDEIQLDKNMDALADDFEYLRYEQNKGNALTDSQKEELKKLPEEQRAEKEKEFLKANEEKSLERRKELITVIEEKIKAAGLPAEATSRLLELVNQLKNNSWNASADAISKLEKATEDELAKKQENKEKDHASDGDIFVPVAAGVVATAAVSAALAEEAKKAEEAAKKEAAGAKLTNKLERLEHMQELTEKVAQKAVAKIAKETGKKPEEITLNDINHSAKLNNMQKKVARKNYLIQHPEIKKDMEAEVRRQLKKSVERMKRKQAEKQAKKESKTLPKQVTGRPNYTKEEWALVKKVNKIKQRGQALTIEEVSRELTPEDAEAYTKFMKKHHPELFRNQIKRKLEEKRDAYRRMQQAQAKTDSMQDRTAKKERTLRPEETQRKARQNERKHPIKDVRAKTARTKKKPINAKKVQEQNDLRSHLRNIRKRENTAKGILANSAVNKLKKGY